MDKSESTSGPASGTGVYGEFLRAELEAQTARKTSFEQRGLAVVTTAGVIVPLLLAFAALAAKDGAAIKLTDSAKVALAIGIGLLVVSAVVALLTNLPVNYEAVPAEAVEKRLKEDPVRDEIRAAKDIALSRLKVLRDAKTKNGRKGQLLFAAIVVEVAAIACVGVAVGIVVFA